MDSYTNVDSSNYHEFEIESGIRFTTLLWWRTCKDQILAAVQLGYGRKRLLTKKMKVEIDAFIANGCRAHKDFCLGDDLFIEPLKSPAPFLSSEQST